jgi:hypothetical protein
MGSLRDRGWLSREGCSASGGRVRGPEFQEILLADFVGPLGTSSWPTRRKARSPRSGHPKRGGSLRDRGGYRGKDCFASGRRVRGPEVLRHLARRLCRPARHVCVAYSPQARSPRRGLFDVKWPLRRPPLRNGTSIGTAHSASKEATPKTLFPKFWRRACLVSKRPSAPKPIYAPVSDRRRPQENSCERKLSTSARVNTVRAQHSRLSLLGSRRRGALECRCRLLKRVRLPSERVAVRSAI